MYHYEECGLHNIWLQSGYEESDTPYGKAVSIHDMNGLHHAIGIALITNKPQLSGDEFRFLRIEMDLPQSQLALSLGVSESTIRNWEKDRVAAIQGPADRMIRLLYREYTNGSSPIREMIDRLSQLNQDAYQGKLAFEETESGWKAAA
ncbi:MAG: helix-turn-helix domain-containing protein [Thiotrichaceae bacterium]|nr:helix-turn-helix domain-containing protein [Thiotrichaceae bacterium]PCI12159.1 MAG: transcriptional regulator [Thiotrichales bacterium]